jgi:hypothetical protein
VSASVAGVATPATFNLTNNFEPPVCSPSFRETPQSTTVGTHSGAALQAKVTDRFGNPVSDIDVRFSAPSSGAQRDIRRHDSVFVKTNSAGIATTPLPLANNTAGSYSVIAM